MQVCCAANTWAGRSGGSELASVRPGHLCQALGVLRVGSDVSRLGLQTHRFFQDFWLHTVNRSVVLINVLGDEGSCGARLDQALLHLYWLVLATAFCLN